jgi:ABC-2 type transport system ATP-binding protein
MNERRGPGLAAPAHAAPGPAPRGPAATGRATGRATGQASTGLAIEATGLTKSYKDVRVLSGVDLKVPSGTVFALLGPNGAGKTTTVRILATLVRADGGQARVAGHDVRRDRSQVRKKISLTGQFAALDEVQTGTENLRMMGRLSGLSRAAARQRAHELIEQFELTTAAGRRVATYSGGMRRRLDIAASLVARPSVIFLDEPSTGLDPQSRLAMWRVIKGLAASGVTIFLTTQYLEEAERLAGRIAVLDAGTIIAEGTSAELKRKVAAQRLDITGASRTAFEELARHFGGRLVHQDDGSLTVGVPTEGGAAEIRALLDGADPGRDLIADFAVHRATLDDVFLTLTGHAK